MQKTEKKSLQFAVSSCILCIAVTLIALKREVAARQKDKLRQVFRGANVKLGNWRQVTVRITTDY